MKMNLFIALVLVALAATKAHADIAGFGGNGSGWSLNGHTFFNDPAPATVNNNVLDITDSNRFYEVRSAFYNTTQFIGGFTASFTYQDLTLTNPGDGIVFTLQNQGPTSVGG